jgi:hypothetical protein
VRKSNIFWQNGVCFAVLKIRVGSVFMNRRSKIRWLFKLLTEDGTWQTILKRKYIGTKALSQVLWKPGDSHFWTGLMATKTSFFYLGSFSIKDGSEIRF